MKAVPIRIANGCYYHPGSLPATHLILHYPGPMPIRCLPIVIGSASGPNWGWNGDSDKPTLTPSILTKNHKDVCHSFVKDGKVQFLDDSTHELAGQKVDLLDVTDKEIRLFTW